MFMIDFKQNNMKIIAYGSRYGTAKRYAEELARRTGIEAMNYEEIDDVNNYETISYILDDLYLKTCKKINYTSFIFIFVIKF